MSLVLYGNGIIDKRGSVSGLTYSRSKFGATVRAKTSPINIVNAPTTKARTALQNAAGLWSSLLTEPQRQAWNAFALLNPRTNVFGQIAYLSGAQWFTKCAINQTNANIPVSVTPPSTGAFPALTSLSVTSTAGSPGSLVMTWTNPTLPGLPTMQCWATPNLSPGVSYANNQLRFVTYNAPTPSPSDIEADWHIRFGGVPFITGKKIFVLAFNMDLNTGVTSAGILASCIIT